MKQLLKKLFFLILLALSFAGCSKSNQPTEPPTLSISNNSADFKNQAGQATVQVSTNCSNWSVSVSSDSRAWCTATAFIQDKIIEIKVTENPQRNIRESKITVSAPGVENKTITVRQLGYEAAILVSENSFNVEQMGGNISFKVTTNVSKFTFSYNDWIHEPSQNTKAAEMVTTDHMFVVKPNGTDKARKGTITVKDSESDLNTTIAITQAAMGDYSSANLDGIKEDIKVTVKSGSATSYQAGEGIDKSFDGKYNTIYHSSWNNNSPSYFPITLTYNFEGDDIDYLVYYPRTDGYNGYFMNAEIHAQYNGSTDFVKLLDKNFGGSGTAARVDFKETLKNTKAIKFILKDGYGDGQGFVSCAEMEFYAKNPQRYNPLELFTDASCSQLKAGVTEADIEACQYPFYKKLAYYMYMDKYPKDFRIASFNAYPHPNQQSASNKTNRYSLLDNPTGISVAQDEELIVLAGDLSGQEICLRVQNLDAPEGDGFGGINYPVVSGFNKIKMQSKGLVYVMYHTPDYKTAQPVKIHFATGTVNGYYDVTKHSESDWSRLLNDATDRYFDVVGKYAHLTFPVERFKKNTPNGKELIDTYDRIVHDEMEFMGLFKYNKVFENRMYLNVMYHSYMYATDYHTGYNDNTLDELTNVSKLKTSSIWGPAHEIGHCNQTRPGLLWIGTTEVTNNIFSLYIQTEFGNSSRVQSESLSYEGYVNRYEKAFNSIILKRHAHAAEKDVFCKLIPFWQLYLYCSAVKDNPDFYKDIFEDIRINPDIEDQAQNQINFVLRCCKFSKLNLLDFFSQWGFLTIYDKEIEDYGTKRLNVTQSMIDKLYADVNALNYPKPGVRFEYITDNNKDMFKSPASIVAGTAKINDKTITMSGWKNVVAYEVYNNGSLAFISPESSFTVNCTLDSNTKVYAISATGTKVEVNF